MMFPKGDDMTVSGISSQHNLLTASRSATRKDWQALEQALNSGDLAGAQTAFAALKSDRSQNTQTASAIQSAQTKSSDSIKAALQKLEQALSAGDLAGAKQAFSDLQAQIQQTRQSRSGLQGAQVNRANDHDQDDAVQTAATGSVGVTNDGPDESGGGSTVNVTA